MKNASQSRPNSVYTLYELMKLGAPYGTIGFASCPVEGSQMAVIIDRALKTLLDLESLAKMLNSDERLSPVGRLEKLRPAAASARQSFTVAQLQVQGAASALEKRTKSLLAIDDLKSDDAVGAAVDQEIRAWFKQLSGDDRVKLFARIAAGPTSQDFKILEALTRWPTPGPEYEMAMNAWRQFMGPAIYGTMAEIEAETAAVKWAAKTILEMISHLPTIDRGATAPGAVPAVAVAA